MNQPRISIITIVFNGAATLEKTILSIAGQSYKNIEYIIIDGKSTDSTVDLIKKYDHVISRWVSERDDGLYDAMNKGIEFSTGDYLWFINSGDEIYSADTLQELFTKNQMADIYYGDTVMIDSQGNEIGKRRLSPPEHLQWANFLGGMVVSHQSFICSSKVAGKYNLRYRFSADYEWCLLALKNAKTICNAHQILSRFLDGGITKKNVISGLKERFRIMVEHFGLIRTICSHVVLGLKLTGFIIIHKRF
jgi:glycosyltransferase involved in cell wall biosynthesis